MGRCARVRAAGAEAWLALVAKVLKGPTSTRGWSRARLTAGDPAALWPRRHGPRRGADGAHGVFPGGWDVRQRHAEADAKVANAAILEDLAGGATSLLLQITAPGQAGMGYGAEALSAALKGVFLDACGLALDAARTPWTRPAA
jgi:methylmalonyl-CoA mutase